MKWTLLFILLLLSSILINPAHADAINFPALLGFGLVIFLPLFVFVFVTEAIVFSRLVPIPSPLPARFFLLANSISFLMGLPAFGLNFAIREAFLPRDLPEYKVYGPYFLILEILIYFVVTILLECALGARWVKKKNLKPPKRQILRGIFIANCATYTILGPLHFIVAKPEFGDLNEFTRDPKWTRFGSTILFYVDRGTHSLMRMNLDGSNNDVWVPYDLDEYLLSSDLDICLFQGRAGGLFHYVRSTNHLVQVADDSQIYCMNHVALSPSGSRVAFLKFTEDLEKSEFTLYDVETNHIRTTDLVVEGYLSDLLVAWASDESTLYLRQKPEYNKWITTRIDISNATRTITTPITEKRLVLNPCYGRVGKAYVNPIRKIIFLENKIDECGDRVAYSYSFFVGYQAGVSRSSDKTQILDLTDHYGLARFNRLFFTESFFLPDCNEVLLQDSGHAFYILDIDQSKIGRVANGFNFVLLNPKYQKTKYFLNRGR